MRVLVLLLLLLLLLPQHSSWVQQAGGPQLTYGLAWKLSEAAMAA
jgi:hypothetical protein